MISPYYIDLSGDADPAHGTPLTFRLYVTHMIPTIQDEGDRFEGWNYSLANTTLQRLKIEVRSSDFSYADGSTTQDSGERRKLEVVLFQPYLRITDSNLPRQSVFYKALTGFSGGEISTYGFVDAYPIDVVRESVEWETNEVTGEMRCVIMLLRSEVGL